MKPNDLRGILHYIPRFRGKTFVIAVDGSIVAKENFANVLLDIAVLRSLNISIVLVHGAAYQIEALAQHGQVTPSDLTGEGKTDDPTLELAMTAGNRLAHEILEGFAMHDLRAAVTNAIKAHPVGIIGGEEQLNTGKVERIDSDFLNALLDRDVIPIVPPLGFDGSGKTFRVNSDAMAVSVADVLRAVKLIYVTSTDGIVLNGELIRELPALDLKRLLEENPTSGALSNLSKARSAIKACQAGVPRVHVINGQTNEGLLTEIFSNEGIGTLIYSNDYQQIRPAQKRDIRVLQQLTRDAMVAEELLNRTRTEIARSLEDYFIFEVDRHPIGCVALHLYPAERTAEIAFLCVSQTHENQGIGRRLIKFVEERASKNGVENLFLLSTQTYSYFQNVAGFDEGTVKDLPVRRAAAYTASGRNSKILVKRLPSERSTNVRADSSR